MCPPGISIYMGRGLFHPQNVPNCLKTRSYTSGLDPNLLRSRIGHVTATSMRLNRSLPYDDLEKRLFTVHHPHLAYSFVLMHGSLKLSATAIAKPLSIVSGAAGLLSLKARSPKFSSAAILHGRIGVLSRRNALAHILICTIKARVYFPMI